MDYYKCKYAGVPISKKCSDELNEATKRFNDKPKVDIFFPTVEAIKEYEKEVNEILRNEVFSFGNLQLEDSLKKHQLL